MRKVDNLDVTAKLVLAVGAGAAIYLIAVPLAMLLFAAFRGPADYLPFEPGAHWTLEHVRALFTDPLIYTRILPDTLIFVAGTVLVVFAIGLGLAWLVERTDLPGREIWFSLILFPLLVPTPVLAIAWIFLMGPNAGWLNLAIRAALGLDGSGPIDIFSMGGLILCQALASTPFVFLLLAATLRAMDPALEEASSTSGASPLTTFRRVTLPVLLPGLLAPLILITLITAEQFELPLIIGLPAKINVFSYRIYFELNPLSSLPNYGAAAALSLPFVVLGVLLLRRLQPPDQARRQFRHGDRERLPPAAPAARRLAVARARPGESLCRARRGPSRRRAVVDELFRLRAAARRDAGGFQPGSLPPAVRQPDVLAGIAQYVLGRARVRADRDRHRRAARLDHLAFKNQVPARARFPFGASRSEFRR